jgi:hypothetical protein
MRFYVSWYPGDPWYPLYDDDCAMLISVTSVSREWTLGDFAELPCYLMLDSGGYRFANVPSERPTPREVFERQLYLIEGCGIKGILCALDYPILDPDVSSNEKDRCIDQTIAYAYEFRCLMDQYQIPALANCRPLASLTTGWGRWLRSSIMRRSWRALRR